MPYPLFWPLVIVSTPAAFVGGLWKIDTLSYHLLVGVLMALAALRMLITAKPLENVLLPAQWLLITVGVLLGLSAGLTGIGGGVFLSPLLLIFGWCTVRQSTAVAAGFILLNSVGGLAGYMVSSQPWPLGTGWLMLGAFAGCLLGAEIASHRATPVTLRKLLAVVLIIAAVKMIFMAFKVFSILGR
jgi:uncharacterized protein